jgi:hypothetical protein
LKHNLDTNVVLSENSEHPSLYKWFLYEETEGVAEGKRKLIPWYWSLYFTIADVNIVSSFEIERFSSEKENASIKFREFIRAKLIPDRKEGRATSFSMMGTKRTISEIELSIYPVKEVSEEKCEAWGSVSYDYENDFRNFTAKDALTFNVHMQEEKFSRLVDRVIGKSIHHSRFYIRGVHGFYSDWSPSISTDSVKVLTGHVDDHPVDNPGGSAIAPPRLGEVSEFSLSVWDETKFENPAPDDLSDDGGKDAGGPLGIVRGPLPAVTSALDPRYLSLLKSVRFAAWLIALLMLLLLFK